MAPQTLTRRLTAITQAHRAAGFQGLSPASTRQPVVGAVLHGIRRVKDVAQHGKDPLLTEQIRALVATCGGDPQGTRDRALLPVGFAGAFRRSEIVAVDAEALEWSECGLVIHVRRSKTDQEGGAGRVVGIPFGSDPQTCPVRALAQWLAASGLTEGPVFRAVDQKGRVEQRRMHPDSVAYIIKRAARRVGLDDEVLAGHSLRSGHVTQAARNGVPEVVIMSQTGHKSVAMLRRYIRQGEIFRENAAAGLGL